MFVQEETIAMVEAIVLVQVDSIHLKDRMVARIVQLGQNVLLLPKRLKYVVQDIIKQVEVQHLAINVQPESIEHHQQTLVRLVVLGTIPQLDGLNANLVLLDILAVVEFLDLREVQDTILQKVLIHVLNVLQQSIAQIKIILMIA